MHIWIELTHNVDKKNIINKMIGTTGLNGLSYGLPCNVPQRLTIPLLFSFCRYKNLSLPIGALRDNNYITLKFFFEKKNNCMQVGNMPRGDLTNVLLWVDNIYLDNQEKKDLAQKPYEYLIEVTQHLKRNLIYGNIKTIQLPFTLSCKELMWVVQNKKPNGDKFTDFTFNNSSMVNNVQFKFNSKNVFSSGARTNDYFNYVIPYQFHSSMPDLGINAWSLSLNPQSLEPTGFINFGHLKQANININTQPNGIMDIFALSYNIMHIEGGNIKLIHKY